MKTGDPQGPWVRIPPSPPFTTESPFTNFALEKYSRGRRGAPAKGVGRETGARVQIPPSPPRRRKRYIACGDFFVKITARSFCCGFFPPRNFASQIFEGPLFNPARKCGAFRFVCRDLNPSAGGAGKKSDRRLRRMQGGFFGAAVGKAEAAASADGRAGHRKRGRAFRSGHAALKATWNRPPPRLPASGSCSERCSARPRH